MSYRPPFHQGRPPRPPGPPRFGFEPRFGGPGPMSPGFRPPHMNMMRGPRPGFPRAPGFPRPPRAAGPPPPPRPPMKRPAPAPPGSIPAEAMNKWGFLHGWINSYASELPQAILDKCKPLHCELCAVQMNAAQQAQMHYDGKLHDKKARMFLNQWSKENEQPAPQKKVPDGPTAAKVAKTIAKETKDQLRADDLYCNVCDLSFTSQIHAEQHYMGRNHKRKSSGMDPLKPGYFNRNTGKWQRKPPGEEEQQEASNFVTLGGGSNPVIAALSSPPPPPPPPGLGGAYPPPPPPPGTDYSQSIPSGSSPQKQQKEAAPQASQPSNSGRLFCEACKVGATSQQQLDMHLNGKAHRMRVDGRSPHSGNRGTQPQPPSRPPQSAPPPVADTPSIKGKDLSIYRTPSGQYYCSPCNLSLNSESQFSQHCDSKKHKIKLSMGSATRGRGGGRGGGGAGIRGRGGSMMGGRGGSSGFSYSGGAPTYC